MPSLFEPAGAAPSPRSPTDGEMRLALETIQQKLKLLEFGLYGLQQLGRRVSADLDDLGPFYRLAEEIGSDVSALRERLLLAGPEEPAP